MPSYQHSLFVQYVDGRNKALSLSEWALLRYYLVAYETGCVGMAEKKWGGGRGERF